jgi:hypothetical protein
MIENELPEVDTLTSYDDVERRARHGYRRRSIFIAAAAAVAVLVAGGLYGVTKAHSDTTNQPVHPPSTAAAQAYLDNGATKAPGRYRMLVGVDDSGASITADFTFYDAWEGGGYPVYRTDAGTAGGMAIYQPIALAAGNGCLSDPPSTSIGQTTHQVAKQLARLPQSTVLQSPTTMRAFGQEAVHLRLRVNQERCGHDIYRVAESLRGDHGITYGPRPVLIDFWVLNLGGIPVVVETWHEDNAPSQMVDQIARTQTSITFVTKP